MEAVFAIAIGVLAGSGVWLVLRPRTFQVLMGLTLLSYATNLFIFGMGRLQIGRAPIIAAERVADASQYADPVPQALVLTAIVIGFGTTALLLVLLLALRALTGTDHVDGRDEGVDARARATLAAFADQATDARRSAAPEASEERQ
jgi:multicomponent K+:H+ antiporter subunit C